MILVLRYGHRYVRDDRVSTHVCLVSRAFGADGIVLDNKDLEIREKVEDINKRWGGKFFVGWVRDPILFFREFKGVRVHLTMYGINVDDIIEEIRKEYEKKKRMVIVIGSEKVPKEFYEYADYNVAIGHQPHSEIAALAVFLDRFFEGKELKRKFEGAEIEIIPLERGKKIRKLMK